MEQPVIEQNRASIVVESKIEDDEIDLRELFKAIWQGKWFILIFTVLFALAAIVYAIKQPDIYQADTLLAPVAQEKPGGLSSLAGQFSGFASMAGINLGGAGAGDKTQIAMEIMKSRKFIGEFIIIHNLLPDLMAVKGWDREANKIIYDEKIYNKEQDKWLREVDLPFKPKPSLQEAVEAFRKVFVIEESKSSGLITISIKHYSPYIAKTWVDLLVKEINQEIKTREVLEAEKSTEFLNKQLQKTDVADNRLTLYELIEEQTKTIMFANVRDEYVFKTIDPPVVAELKVSPKRALILAVGVLLGMMLSILLILGRYLSVAKR